MSVPSSSKEVLDLGYLLPSVIRVREMIRAMRPEVTHCVPLIDAPIAGLNKRFGQYLNDARHILAAITLPLFKNLEFFEDDQESKDRFKQILIEKVQVILSVFFYPK